jgi:predicted nucleotidyltransferase
MRLAPAAALLMAASLSAAPLCAAVASRSAVRSGPAAVPGLPSAGLTGAPASGLTAGSLQAPGLIPGLAALPSPSLSVSAAPAAGPFSLSAAALPAPNSVIPAVLPAPEAKVPAALSPERQARYQELSSRISAGSKAAPGEQSKTAADRFFEPSRTAAVPGEAPELGPVAAGVSATLAPAAPARRQVRSDADALRREPYRPEAGGLAALKDRWHHARLLAGHLYWYTVTHIADMWPAYQEKILRLAAQDEPAPVSRARTFFSYMRVMGETGIFYTLGFAALNDQDVLQESRRTFARFFDGPGIGAPERQAFERFLGRIAVFNKAHRAHSNMKKHIRDALLAASVMPARAIAPFFDSLALQDKTAEIEDFQREGAAEVLKTFRRVVQETLAEEPDSPDAVLGVVLMGSFARGAATPTSDLDAELIVRDGREGRVQAFSDRLVARWEALGLQKDNPVTPHEHPLHPSKRLLALVHVSGDFLVFSNDRALEDALSPRPGEPPAFVMVRHRTLRGWLGRTCEYAAVYAVTLWTDLKRALRR